MIATALLLALAPAPQLSFQFPKIDRYEFQSAADDDFYGASIVVIGDVDGDGADDYAVGRPGYDVGFFGIEDSGEIVIRSGATGAVLDSIVWVEDNLQIGRGAMAGGFDSDLDGLPEIAATSVTKNKVYVFEFDLNGSNTLLTTIDPVNDMFFKEKEFGTALANVGDVDGDGRDDLAVGIPDRDVSPGFGISGTGRVRIISGADYATGLNLLSDGVVNSRFGTSIAVLDDFFADGIAELAIGAPGSSNVPGRVWLYDPRSGAFPQILGSYSNDTTDRFGLSLTVLGDIDGGGRDELVVGSIGSFSAEGVDSSGALQVVSLDTGETLWSLEADAATSVVVSKLTAGDFDNDGSLDVATIVRPVASSGAAGAYELVLLDGQNGDQLASFDAWAARDFTTTYTSEVVALTGQFGPDRVLVGLPNLEHARGGEVLYELDLLPTAPDLGPFTVNPTSGTADFEALSHATLVVPPGTTLNVVGTGQGDVEITKPLEVFGPKSFLSQAGVGNVRVSDTSEVTLWRLQTVNTTVERVGRAHLIRLTANSLAFEECPDVLVSQTTVPNNGPLFQLDGPGIRVADSFVQLRDVTANGPEVANAIQALDVESGGQVWATGCSFFGNNDFFPRSAVIVRDGGQLDVRGNSADVIDSQDPNGLVADMIVEPGATVQVGPEIPPFQTTGGGVATSPVDARPWMSFNGTAPIGASLQVSYYDDAGSIAALLVGFLPVQIPFPTIVDIPLLVDLSLTLPGTVLIASDPEVATVVPLPIPDDPNLVGVALELQGFTIRPDGLFDGTNGGRSLIR